jgi:lysophospholipase L1-like esterase
MSFKPPVGVGSPFDQAPELRAFRAAWSKRFTKPCNVVVIGDSITQGYWATNWDKRMFDVFMARLCQVNGQPIPVGYVPLCSAGSASYTGRDWTKVNTVTDELAYGLGYAAANLAVSPVATANFTDVCDRIWVHYPDVTQFVGTFSIQVDNVTVGNITPSANARNLGGRVWQSAILNRARHDIKVTCTDGLFPPIIEGCTMFDGNGPTNVGAGILTAANAKTGAGIRMFGAGHNGFTAGSWNQSPGSSIWWTDGLDTIDPHLVIICLGVNDEFTGVSIATYETNLNGIITKVNSVATANGNLPPSFCIVAPYGTGSAGDMRPFRDAGRRVALARNVAFVDWYALAGDIGTSTLDVYELTSSLDDPSDRKHPTDAGHQLLGDNLALYLTNTIGPTGQIPRQPVRTIIAAGRSVNDAVLNSTTTLTSATASFQTTDVGKTITGIGIPMGTTISARASTTSITLSAAATMSTTAVTIGISDAVVNPQHYVDNVIVVNASAVVQPILIPSPIGQAGQEFTIKKIDNSSNPVILYGAAGATIDDGAQYDLRVQYHTITIKSDGQEWWCI